MLLRAQSGDGICKASTLYKYNIRDSDLFIMNIVLYLVYFSDVLIEDVVTCINVSIIILISLLFHFVYDVIFIIRQI